MKTILKPKLLCFCILQSAYCLSARAQVTAFTYQGRLNNNGSPANGNYDFRFRLSSDSLGNNYVGGTVLSNALPVSGGLFTVALDFGAGVFTGSNYWLEVDVKTNGAGGYTALAPLQNLTPSPYAIFAGTAGNLSGALASGQLAGTYSGAVTLNNANNSFAGGFTGNGSNVTNVNAIALGGLGVNQFWKTTGNSNTGAGVNFLGTADNQPLELAVNGQRVLRLEPTTNSPNSIGGFSGNYVTNAATGAVIGGGGASAVFGASGLNRVTDDFGVVGGGADNRAGNTNADPADAYYATVGGGVHNVAEGIATFIGGGAENRAANNNSTIAGGYQNMASGYISMIGGGRGNTNVGYNSFIGGGGFNFIGDQADSSTIGGGWHNQIIGSASSGVSGTIAGGFYNNIDTNGAFCTIGGGFQNNIQADAYGGTIGGGLDGFLAGKYATIPGGFVNTATGFTSFAAGRRARANHDGAFVWADSLDADFDSTATNQFNVRANGGVRFVTGGAGMTLDGSAVALRTGGNAFTGQQTINGGNVGIGTASPGQLLQVGDSSVAGSQGMIHLGSRSPSGASLRDWELGVPQTLDDVSGDGYSFVIRDATVGPGSGTRLMIKWGTGNVGIGTSAPGHLLQVGANISPPYCDGLTWVNGSDRNAKENFKSVDALEVLAKVATLPLSRWNYKADQPNEHLGPMAQDFHAAFGLNGADDKHIATVDADGVALAAIQGLNQKLEEQRAENVALKQRLETIEKILGTQKTN